MLFTFINISHLHPLLVHLPIGILILLFVLEVILRKNQSEEAKKILSYTLLLALITSVLSLFTGWKLGAEGGYEGALLKLHKWTAVGLTAAIAVLWVLKVFVKEGIRKIYWFLLISILILLTITGHYGASMTHGENFLFEKKETVTVSISDVNQAKVYQDIIRPIFENNCTSCHNTGKANGGLIMSTKEYLLKGGKSGDFFSLEGEASALSRLHLPLDDKKHMPPNGKVQLTEEQVFYLEWWINNEHCFDCTVSVLKPNERELELLKQLEEDNSITAELERELEPFPSSWINRIRNSNISIQPLNNGSKLVSVNFSQKKQVTENELDLLSQFSENIIELNLSNSDVSDELSNSIVQFENLLKLQLANTKITDKSVKALSELQHLESINLYGSDISKSTLDILKDFPALKKAYVWQTDISSADLKKFSESNLGLEVIGQFESPLLADSKLESPIITSSKTLFSDTLHIDLSTDFDGASLFYTLDGTRPDTTSNLFTEAFVLNESSIVSAISYKSDWGSSLPSSSTFKKLQIPLKSAQIKGEIHENYQADGNSSVMDGVLGSNDFKDGNWLGFQGVSPSFVLSIDKATEISNVSVSAMSSQPSWIFYPKGFTVLVSNNKNSWEKVHYSSYASVKQNPETEKQFFDLRFEPVNAKYIKVVLESPLKLPEWHASPGEPCYVFIDEILVE